ncbi:MAG: hypothetical protein GX601_09340 [Anaerolineales bacterium]|jgi:hypothetical protein|nr:hypothetical protein [Anaerolineales bacterium]
MITEHEVRCALKEIERVQEDLFEAQSVAAEVRAKVRERRADVDAAKRALEAAIVQATAEAMFGNSPVVDGRNAEARKAQLDAYLSSRDAVRAARAEVVRAERALVDAESELDLHETAARNLMIRANLWQAKVDLQAAYCRMASTPAAQRHCFPQINEELLWR